MVERGSQEQVFRELYPLVRKQLFFQLAAGQSHLLDEIVQECMVEIFSSLDSFRGEAKLSTWALTIAVRKGRRLAKRARRMTAISLDDWNDARFAQAPSESAIQLGAMISKLRRKKREAFVLMDVMGMTAVEAGDALGVSPNTAASRCRHARDELRALFQEGTV